MLDSVILWSFINYPKNIGILFSQDIRPSSFIILNYSHFSFIKLKSSLQGIRTYQGLALSMIEIIVSISVSNIPSSIILFQNLLLKNFCKDTDGVDSSIRDSSIRNSPKAERIINGGILYFFFLFSLLRSSSSFFLIEF